MTRAGLSRRPASFSSSRWASRFLSSASCCAYDAATVVLDALRKRQGGETLKDALLKNSPYQGLPP